MSENVNLDLDVDQTGLQGLGDFVARITVQNAQGYTRDGAGPVITIDCATHRALELEVERLKAELDDALQRAGSRFNATHQERVESISAQRNAAEINRGEKAQVAADLKVRDVMTLDVRTMNENDKLTIAEELMKQGKFRHVVVLDDDAKIAGVVSHRDIFYSAITWSSGLGRFAHAKALESLPVKQVMNSSPRVVSPDIDLGEAAALMAERKIGCLPVTEGEELVGILTEGDFLALII